VVTAVAPPRHRQVASNGRVMGRAHTLNMGLYRGASSILKPSKAFDFGINFNCHFIYKSKHKKLT
jgi:hypothetical protein